MSEERIEEVLPAWMWRTFRPETTRVGVTKEGFWILEFYNRRIRRFQTVLYDPVTHRFVSGLREVEPFHYALGGDSKNRYPYRMVIDYVLLAGAEDLPVLRARMRENRYWGRYVETGDLKVESRRGRLRWAFRGKPVIYIREGKFYGSGVDLDTQPCWVEHQAGIVVGCLKTLGLAKWSRRREPIVPEEYGLVSRVVPKVPFR